MSEIYSVLYINTDEPKNSEVYGTYSSREKAVDGLLKCAGYWTRENGEVRLHNELVPEKVWKNIRENVYLHSELSSVDIFRIQEHRLE